MNAQIITLLSDIRRSVSFDRYEFLHKGHSNARKLVLFQADQPVYLLRIYDSESYARRLEEYNYIKRHYDNGVLCQKPVSAGSADDLKLCYLLLTYAEGESGEEALPAFPAEDQYTQGVVAGKQLKKIHDVEPDSPIRWAERRYEKYLNKKSKVRELDLAFHRQHEIESFIERHVHLLRESPVRFQHDDFHPANLIFKQNKLSGIIDFSRFDWGDPWEEFSSCPNIHVT